VEKTGKVPSVLPNCISNKAPQRKTTPSGSFFCNPANTKNLLPSLGSHKKWCCVLHQNTVSTKVSIHHPESTYTYTIGSDTAIPSQLCKHEDYASICKSDKVTVLRKSTQGDTKNDNMMRHTGAAAVFLQGSPS
jgi:hypothetical protein